MNLLAHPNSGRQDVTCYTSPTSTTVVQWPSGHQPYTLAVSLFACIFLAVTVVWIWAHYRPCESCGEYKLQCRCKARDY